MLLDQTKQLEQIEGEHIRDVKLLGSKVKEKLLAEFVHVPAEEQDDISTCLYFPVYLLKNIFNCCQKQIDLFNHTLMPSKW